MKPIFLNPIIAPWYVEIIPLLILGGIVAGVVWLAVRLIKMALKRKPSADNQENQSDE